MTASPTTRASLLLRLGDSRDYEAWQEFVSLYEPVIYRLLRRHGLQDADARELMQELLLAVSQNVDHWDPDQGRGSFRGWLSRVARNLVINWLKHSHRKMQGSGDTKWQMFFDQVPTGELAETAEFDREVRRALFRRAGERVRNEVGETTWQAFWETGINGMSPLAASGKLGMSAGAVRVAKCRVLARLRTAVGELEKTL